MALGNPLLGTDFSSVCGGLEMTAEV